MFGVLVKSNALRQCSEVFFLGSTSPYGRRRRFCVTGPFIGLPGSGCINQIYIASSASLASLWWWTNSQAAQSLAHCFCVHIPLTSWYLTCSNFAIKMPSLMADLMARGQCWGHVVQSRVPRFDRSQTPDSLTFSCSTQASPSVRSVRRRTLTLFYNLPNQFIQARLIPIKDRVCESFRVLYFQQFHTLAKLILLS
jgi:hypothetical protein